MSNVLRLVPPAVRTGVARWSTPLDDRLFAIPSALFLLAPLAAVVGAVFGG